MAHFSGLPITRWEKGKRIMTLIEPFSYTDKYGKEWKVDPPAELNGATIPRILWSIIGSPYVGKYRRASIVHDFHVGEGSNADVSYEERRAADLMFKQACRTDGCSWLFSKILYAGVSAGSWASRKKMKHYNESPEYLMEKEIPMEKLNEEDRLIVEKYHQILDKIDEVDQQEEAIVKNVDHSIFEAYSLEENVEKKQKVEAILGTEIFQKEVMDEDQRIALAVESVMDL